MYPEDYTSERTQIPVLSPLALVGLKVTVAPRKHGGVRVSEGQTTLPDHRTPPLDALP